MRGKASHSVWEHSGDDQLVIFAGQDGDDADRYQEKQVAETSPVFIDGMIRHEY